MNEYTFIYYCLMLFLRSFWRVLRGARVLRVLFTSEFQRMSGSLQDSVRKRKLRRRKPQAKNNVFIKN